MYAKLPAVAIIGRPNVGKSTLFNRLVGRKAAIVDDMPGVSRDRNYARAAIGPVQIMLIDTGGLIPNSRDGIARLVGEQVAVAMEEADAIVFLVDASPGPTDLDVLIAQKLRRQCPEKVILAANKAESPRVRQDAARHIELGFGEPRAISALHGQGIADLCDAITEALHNAPAGTRAAQAPADISIAILGRPNAGKSLLVNKLLKKKRMIVDEKPGTTRDAVDSYLAYNKQTVVLVDTAGLRRKSQIRDSLEYYTNVRALGAIERADVCVLMIDASAGVATQDLKIFEKIDESRKPAIVCLNKWDLVEKDHRTFDRTCTDMRHQYKELCHIPIIALSALNGLRIWNIIETACLLQQRMRFRPASKEITTAFFEWTRTHPHPVVPNKSVRFLGIKQARIHYPFFYIFCTNPAQIQPSYERFLKNKIYELCDFGGCPLVLAFKPPGTQRT